MAQSKEAFDRKSRRLKAIIELRKLIVDGHSPGEIQEALGLSRRTYYRYLRTAFAPDRQAFEAQNTNEIMRQVSILVERNNKIYQILKDIATDPKVSGEDRIEACREMNAVTKGNLDIYKQTPAVPIHFKKFIERLKRPDVSSSSSRFLPPAMYDPTEQQQQQEQVEVVRAGDTQEEEQQQRRREWWVDPRSYSSNNVSDYRP